MKRILLPAAIVVSLALAVSTRAMAQSDDSPPLVTIDASGDSFVTGDGSYGPNVPETISYAFSISKYLITNRQFALFISDKGYATRDYWTTNGWAWKGAKTQPSLWANGSFNGPDQPVVGVSWYEAVAFCNWLSITQGLEPAYDASGMVNLAASGYRLPTEVEWEYAAAKGGPDQSERISPWGDTWDSAKAACRVRPASASKTAIVGSKSPGGDTPQGLADMSGNAWEWCSDNAQSDAGLAGASSTDRYYFTADSAASYFVLRGGSWYVDFEAGFRCAFRNFTSVPGSRYNVAGFRVVRR